METLLQAAGGAVNGRDSKDEVTIAMVRAGPDMFMPADEEICERATVLKWAIEEARTEG